MVAEGEKVSNKLRDELQAVINNQNLQAFFRVLRAGESSQTDDAYRTQVGGKLLSSLTDHPRERVYIPSLKLWSTAAGAYQFLQGTWDECAKALGLTDFGKESQDLAAAFLIRRRGAMPDVLAGRLQAAIAKCAKEWASLPGSPYGQPVRTMSQAKATYEEYGGTNEAIPSIKPEEPMLPLIPAIISAFLPKLIEAVPKLTEIFPGGSEVAQRNVKAATLVFDIAKEALHATNEQDVVEQIRTSPEAVAAVQKAIEDNWFSLKESGSGGIDGARKADGLAAARGDLLQSPSFWIAMALLPLVYMIAGTVAGFWGAPFSEDVRSAIANGLVGMIIGSLAGYYFGQMTSRNRT